jgi:citrate lyase beta subunit
MIEKGLTSSADAVFLDLEDSVAPETKATARERVVEALRAADWRGRRRTVRINSTDSPESHRDLIFIVEQAGERLDAIIVPKVDGPPDVHGVSMLLTQLERSIGRAVPISLEIQIESAAGLLACDAIASADSRVEALIFGPGDFAGSMGMPWENLGAFDNWERAYPGHRWHFAMTQIALVARARGLRAIDGPYADFQDMQGLRDSAMIARGLGYDAKWCIHPAQIDTVADVFTPSAADVSRAQSLVYAYDEAIREGRGAADFEGQMIDAASLRLARLTIDRAANAASVPHDQAP